MLNRLKPLSNATLLAVALSALSALSACSMAPRYQQPTVMVAPTFPSANTNVALAQTGAVAASNLGWQEYFADARLRQLIELALANNKDLRVAALNVEAVRAQYAIARADRLPAIGATGAGTKARVAEDLSTVGRSYIAESYNVGLGVTAFELDLFGRVKSLSNAALNQYFAQEQARDATQISLIASVAKAYFAERSAQANMNLSERVLKTREESKRLTDLKFKAGVISAIDVDTAVSQIEAARSDYAAAERSRDQARNALALLVGQPLPESLPAEAPLTVQFTDNELPVGLPSEILYQRPDVRQAEFALQSANANIGAARAAFFPRITLTGSVGSGSTELSGLFTGGNATWSFVPQITLPIFSWGQNKAKRCNRHFGMWRMLWWRGELYGNNMQRNSAAITPRPSAIVWSKCVSIRGFPVHSNCSMPSAAATPLSRLCYKRSKHCLKIALICIRCWVVDWSPKPCFQSRACA